MLHWTTGRLHGAVFRSRGSLLWTGERAPTLSERDDGSWRQAEPINLFDGQAIQGWHTLRPGREEGWYVEDGVMKNRRRADLLVSDETFWNFVLKVEYLVHPGMNGGIGLRGRYEIQLLDDFGQEASDHGNGALYGRIAPSVNASRPAGEWQTLEIRLVGREVTVVLNGIETISRATVDGFTAMATDWREDQPGPITLQGDHGAIGIPEDGADASRAMNRTRPIGLAAVILVAVLYLLPIPERGLVGPDEPRYASVARNMGRVWRLDHASPLG